jgi:hypothetical protein
MTANSGARSRAAHSIRKRAGARGRWPRHSRYRSGLYQDHYLTCGGRSRRDALY